MSVNKVTNFVVRQMKQDDFDEVRQIWTILNFFFSKYDNYCMVKVDAEGLFVAEDPKTGKILGCCSGVNLSKDLAFIGQYAVRREYQGLGIGSELWRKVMEHIGTDINIGLWSRPEMGQKYRDKYNFEIMPGKDSYIMTGKVDCSQLIEAIDGISVVPISEDNIERVIQYDKEVCGGLDRSVLIREMSRFDEDVKAVAVNQSNQVLGYCALRVSNFNSGIVEPLYANDEKIAELLLNKCCQSLAISQTNGVIFRCFKTHTKAMALANKIGFKVERDGKLQFTKGLVEGDYERIFGISSVCFHPF